MDGDRRPTTRARTEQGSRTSREVHVISGSAFAIVGGAADSPVVFHVPHAARAIPPDARASILLDDEQLSTELGHMTDAHTDVLAAAAAEATHPTPWQFLNRCSRLVVDPERFPDEREEMLAVGMGAVYTRTSHNHPLRPPDSARDTALIDTYFTPYAEALADLVDARLDAVGAAVILDLHSYPLDPLPYELHADQRRPAICLGTDAQHTPAWLVEAARRADGCRGDRPRRAAPRRAGRTALGLPAASPTRAPRRGPEPPSRRCPRSR